MKNNTRHPRKTSHRNRQQHSSSAGIAMGAGMALFAGAAMGGAIMWLFDPKVGAARRQRIGQAAHGAMDQGKDVIGAAIGTVASHAGEVAGHLRSHLHDASDSMSALASDAANSAMSRGSGMAHDAASHLMNHAKAMRDNATDYANRQLRRVGNAMPHDREHHVVGQTACAVSSLALGAGAVYFLDRENGARRRSEFAERVFKMVRMGGQMCNDAGQFLREKLMGSQMEADSMPSSEAGSAEQSEPHAIPAQTRA